MALVVVELDASYRDHGTYRNAVDLAMMYRSLAVVSASNGSGAGARRAACSLRRADCGFAV